MQLLSVHLRALRTSLGLSLEAAGERAAISKSTLGRIESGLQTPSIPQLQQLADLYKTTTSEMLNGRKIEDLVPLKIPPTS